MEKKDNFHGLTYFLILSGLCVILYYNINISSSMLTVSQIVIYSSAVIAIIAGLMMGILNFVVS